MHPRASLFLRLAVTFALALATAVTAACGGSNSEDGDELVSSKGPTSCEPRRGGEITVAFNDDLPTFDPSQNPIVGATAFNATPLVFDRLVRPSTDLKEMRPQLATSVTPNDDFTKWTIKLRDGVTFHDGSKFDSKDVVWTLNYYLEGYNGYALGPISDVKAVDPLTVEVQFKSPYSTFQREGLASFLTGFMLPEKFGGKSAEEFGKAPVGTGPYAVTEYKPGNVIEYERNRSYFEPDRPYLDKIEFRIVADANDRILGLEAGEFQLIDRYPADQIDNLPENAVARVIDPTASTDTVFLSGNVDLFKDPKVRKAISLAINREEIAEAAYAGHAEPAQSLNPPALPGVPKPPADRYVYDLDEAKRLMAESSHPDGGKVSLTYIKGDANTKLEAELIQEDLSEIGIDMTLSPVGFSEYFDQAVDGRREFTLFKNEAVTPDAIDFLGFYVDSKGYYGDWPTEFVAKLIDKLNKTDDPAAKATHFGEYEEYTAENSQQIPVVAPKTLDAQSSDLSGLNIDALNEADFAGAWLC